MEKLRAALGLVILVGACGGGGAATNDAAAPDGPGGSAVGYYETVAPVVMTHCVGCHTKGGIGPFPLLTYGDAVMQAAKIRKATTERTMPPWPPGNGACHTWQDARWLSDDEIAAFGNWIDGGMPMGDPAKAPPAPEAPPSLAAVDATIDLGADYRPNEGVKDDYRCFIADPKLDRDRFLSAYEVKPGLRRMVHHVIVYALDTPGIEATLQKLDDADTGPGYSCYGGPGTIASLRLLAGWAPGVAVTRYPEGTGIRLKAGRKVVIQIHYNTANGTSFDRTAIDLGLTDTVASEAEVAFYGVFDLNLPPGQAAALAQKTYANQRNLRVWAAFPHAHKLGRQIGVELNRGGDTSCMLDVPRWDFNWQQFYMYDNPVDLEPGDVLKLSCTFDTSMNTKPVTWGESTSDEMCLVALYFTKR